MRNLLVFILIILSASYLYSTEPAFSDSRSEYFMTTQITVPGGWAAPCVYDWNQDGKKDLIIASGSGNIFVYINYGTDTNPVFKDRFPVLYKGSMLTMGQIYTVLSVYIGTNSDLNNDGLNDMILGYEQKILIFYNSGTPSAPEFNSDYQTVQLSTNSTLISQQLENIVGADDLIPYLSSGGFLFGSYPVIWDINNDGLKDIVTGYALNKGASGSYIFYAKICAYTNSGTADSPSFTNNFVTLKTNGNDIEIILGGPSAGGFLNYYPPSVYPVYWDSDDKTDLILFVNSPLEEKGGIGFQTLISIWYKGGNNVYNFTNKGYITDESGNFFVDAGFVPSICVTKWNSDNYKDIVIGNLLGSLFLLKGTSDLNKMELSNNVDERVIKANETKIYGWSGAAAQVVDWNNDGNYDIIMGNLSGRNVIFINHGDNETPVYKEAKPITVGTGSYRRIPSSPVFSFPMYFDWNQDGKKDLIIGGGRSEYFYVFYNISTNDNEPLFSDSYTNYTIIKAGDEFLSTGSYSVCKMIDWDLDGDNDLIAMRGEGEGDIKLYLSDGTNSDGSPKLLDGDYMRFQNGEIMSTGDRSSVPQILDWDDDGDRDIVISSSGKIYLFRNNGTDRNPVFTRIEFIKNDNDVFNAGQFPHITILDWNKDGWWDIVLSNDEGYVSIFYGAQPRYVAENDDLLPANKVKNYPNPVLSNTTTFRYLVRDNSLIKIEVYNLSGELIKTINTEAQFDSINETVLDISEFKNGLYFYKITATSKNTGESVSVIKKFAIIK